MKECVWLCGTVCIRESCRKEIVVNHFMKEVRTGSRGQRIVPERVGEGFKR